MKGNKYAYSGGKQRMSGGFRKANMNAFIYAGGKKHKKIAKRGK